MLTVITIIITTIIVIIISIVAVITEPGSFAEASNSCDFQLVRDLPWCGPHTVDRGMHPWGAVAPQTRRLIMCPEPTFCGGGSGGGGPRRRWLINDARSYPRPARTGQNQSKIELLKGGKLPLSRPGPRSGAGPFRGYRSMGIASSGSRRAAARQASAATVMLDSGELVLPAGSQHFGRRDVYTNALLG
jgi:hypothetical protein